MLRRFLSQIRDERRQYGWKGLVRRRGWKFVVGIILFYLIRDLVLYVLIPVVIAWGILS